jgi:DNA-binding transcriptional regulator YdaS (Cro superfamily)
VRQTPLQNLLHRAAARIGVRTLAARMEVPESLLEAWMSGQATMPAKKILALAEIIEQLDEEPKG